MPKRRLCVALLTTVVVLGSSPSQAATCYAFTGVLESIPASTLGGSSGTPVQRQQVLYIRNQGVAGNPFEIYFQFPGDPNTAQVGDLELMTNSLFARNAGIASAAINLAQTQYVQLSDGQTTALVFQLDPGAANIQPQPNFFVAPGQGGNIGGLCSSSATQSICQSLGQNPVLTNAFLVPTTGWGYLYFPPQAGIFGEMQLNGTVIDNPGIQGQLYGRYSGQFANAFEC